MGPEDRGRGGDYPEEGVSLQGQSTTEPQGASAGGCGQEGGAGVTQEGGPACGEKGAGSVGSLSARRGPTLTARQPVGPEAGPPDPAPRGGGSCENHGAPRRPSAVARGCGVDGSRSPHGQPARARSRGHLSASARAGALSGDPGATAARPARGSLSAVPSTRRGPRSRTPGRGRRLAAALPHSARPAPARQGQGGRVPSRCGDSAGWLWGGPGAWRGWGWRRVWSGPPCPLALSPGGVP